MAKIEENGKPEESQEKTLDSKYFVNNFLVTGSSFRVGKNHHMVGFRC